MRLHQSICRSVYTPTIIYLQSVDQKQFSIRIVVVILGETKKKARGNEKMKNRFDVARYLRNDWAILLWNYCKIALFEWIFQERKERCNCKLVTMMSNNREKTNSSMSIVSERVWVILRVLYIIIDKIISRANPLRQLSETIEWYKLQCDKMWENFWICCNFASLTSYAHE